MIVSSIIIILSLLLDGILSNFLPFMVGKLSYFTPLFTVVSVLIIYPFFKKKENSKYLIITFLTGLVYDLLYTNLLFFHALLLPLLGVITIFLYKYFDRNSLMILIETILIITLYQGLTVIVYLLFQVVPITLNDFLYVLEHTLFINIIYTELGYLIIKVLPEKYLGLSIN